jgi:preprotein translocase subunit SecB
MQMSEQQQPQATGPEFNIQRIYIKDLSLESPNSPEVFRGDWRPEINLELNSNGKKLEGDTYEVILKITITVKNLEKTALLIELHHAGIFSLRGFNQEQTGQVLGALCPNILFPYAREVISEASTRAGFPPLYLAPINFDALYMEQQKRANQPVPEQIN